MNFYSSKNTIKRVERQVRDTEKIYVIHRSHGLSKYPKYTNNKLKSVNQQQKDRNPIKEWAKDLSRHFATLQKKNRQWVF